MEIINENNKRYLITSVMQKGYSIDAGVLFEDLKAVSKMDKENGIDIDRKHPTQSLVNKFSGNYMSPTMLKGFYDCSCNQIFNALIPSKPSDIVVIGRAVHSIFQKFYDQDKELRDINKIYDIMDECIKEYDEENQKNIIKLYVDGFINTPDYLNKEPMDHKSLDCYNELFMKGTRSPLGITLPLPIYCLSDRIDFRDEYAYIIDYKTGTYFNKKIVTMEGYLPQLITYKWSVEEEYGIPVKGAYILAPGTKEKIISLNVNGLENQSRYIEKIFKFNDDFKESARNRIYHQKIMPYCKSCKFKDKCNLYNTKNNDGIIKIKYDITLNED